MNTTPLKFTAVFAYFAMVFVNFLAISLPINNRSTGEISNAYPNLFTPSGITFSIWGLIYLLLGGFLAYQFTKGSFSKKDLLNKVNIYFIGTSVANILWIFSWHYDYIGLSVFIMLILLTLLIKIADIVNLKQFTTIEKYLISTPFNVYFGWITVATIANIIVFLVSIKWNGFGIADYIWTIIILLIGALIAILRIQKDKSIAYGLVLIWAYFGILLKHISVDGFNSQYPSIIITAILCIMLFILFTAKNIKDL